MLQAMTIEENMIVCRGNVKPFPIVDIINNGTCFPSISVVRERKVKSSSKNHFGKSISHNLIEIESDALDRSIVA
jgi:hypothetical protein